MELTKQKEKEYFKQYYQKHREQILMQKIQYYKLNKTQIYERQKPYKKQYYQQNKKHIQEYQKQYHEQYRIQYSKYRLKDELFWKNIHKNIKDFKFLTKFKFVLQC